MEEDRNPRKEREREPLRGGDRALALGSCKRDELCGDAEYSSHCDDAEGGGVATFRGEIFDISSVCLRLTISSLSLSLSLFSLLSKTFLVSAANQITTRHLRLFQQNTALRIFE